RVGGVFGSALVCLPSHGGSRGGTPLTTLRYAFSRARGPRKYCWDAQRCKQRQHCYHSNSFHNWPPASSAAESEFLHFQNQLTPSPEARKESGPPIQLPGMRAIAKRSCHKRRTRCLPGYNTTKLNRRARPVQDRGVRSQISSYRSTE